MVIDTGIFIDFLRAKDKSKTLLNSIDEGEELYVSSITVFELYVGATNQSKLQDLETLIGGLPTLAFSEDIAKLASSLHLDLKRTNRVIDFRDLFIAATAIAHNQPLLTRNLKHFERVEKLQLVKL